MQFGKCPNIGEVFFALCKSIDTPVSLSAWLRYKYSHSELASMAIRPRDYTNRDEFFVDYICTKFLAKSVELNTGIDLETVALQKFIAAEARCKETNSLFRRLATVRNERLHRYLHTAQRKIAKLLGPFSMFTITEGYGWGPGATYEIPRSRAHVDTKLCELPITVSRTARSMLRAEIETDLHWSAAILGHYPSGSFSLLDNVFALQDECRIAMVPKDAKTHRIIAVEPRGNAFLQKGFGSYFRKRLRSVGIDLDDQGVNQNYARRAYDEGLATLDLKAASDTVSKELVWALLPYDWAASLDAVRSRRAEMPDKSIVVLEKFSSMGNGFTFELESLIFWALCSAVRDDLDRNGVVAVYGDDLIVHSSIASDVCLLLQFCGFDVNDEKSFTDGPFYESCGKHYFQGVEVTPAYQKEKVSTPLGSIRLGNRLIRLSARLGCDRFLDKRLYASWSKVRRDALLLKNTIPFGSQGDDAWVVPYNDFPFTAFNLDRLTKAGMGIRCRVLSEQTVSFPANDIALLAWSLRRNDRRHSVHSKVPWDEPPLPYGGAIEIIPKLAKLRETSRRVIPCGQFSLLWQ